MQSSHCEPKGPKLQKPKSINVVAVFVTRLGSSAVGMNNGLDSVALCDTDGYDIEWENSKPAYKALPPLCKVPLIVEGVFKKGIDSQSGEA